jgi:hypothetical protein
MKAKIQGAVRIQVLIDEEGVPRDPTVGAQAIKAKPKRKSRKKVG